MGEVRAVFRMPERRETLDGMQEALRPRIQALGRRITANAKQRVPVDTGTLRRTIGFRTLARGGQVELSLFATAEHASWVHDGTRPHMIVPRRARVLRFQAGGREVFAMRVRHPGTRPRPFMRLAIQEEIQRGV